MKTVYIVMDQDESSCQGSGFIERVFINEEAAKVYCKERRGRWYEEHNIIEEEN